MNRCQVGAQMAAATVPGTSGRADAAVGEKVHWHRPACNSAARPSAAGRPTAAGSNGDQTAARGVDPHASTVRSLPSAASARPQCGTSITAQRIAVRPGTVASPRDRTAGRSPRCTGKSDPGWPGRSCGTLNTGWCGRGRPLRNSMPKSADNDATSTITSKAIGMNTGQLLSGRPPTLNG